MNNNSENRDPTWDRSSNDPCPEVVFSACRISNLNDTDQEETQHSYSSKTKKWQIVKKINATTKTNSLKITFWTKA